MYDEAICKAIKLYNDPNKKQGNIIVFIHSTTQIRKQIIDEFENLKWKKMPGKKYCISQN